MLFTLLVIGLLFYAAAKGYGMLTSTAREQALQSFQQSWRMLDAYKQHGAVKHFPITLPDGSQGFCIFNLQLKESDRQCRDEKGIGARDVCLKLRSYWQAAGSDDENLVTLKGLRARVKSVYFGTVNPSWTYDTLLPEAVKDALNGKERLDWYCFTGPRGDLIAAGIGTGILLTEVSPSSSP